MSQPVQFIEYARFVVLAAFGAAVLSMPLVADHGPGTSGGGSTTQSGETLKPGNFAIELREEYTEFESLSRLSVERSAESAGAIDLLDRSFFHSVALSYGVVENFQVGVSIGYYDAVNPREAEFHADEGETEILNFNPDGITDLWLSGKYRFYRGPLGNIAVFGGVKFPTGRDDVKNSEGEQVEPSATAGSGSYDGMLGLAYSRFITSRVTMDTSFQYTLRSESDDFRLGDRIDAALAVGYRFTEDIQKYPQFSAFGEALLRHLYRSEEEGERDPNTGGTVLFLAPGIRAGLSRHLAATVSAPLPVWQDLNGEQLETDFKILAALTLTF